MMHLKSLKSIASQSTIHVDKETHALIQMEEASTLEMAIFLINVTTAFVMQPMGGIAIQLTVTHVVQPI